MEVIATLIGLLTAVTAFSILSRRLPLPYATVMVLAGLGISFVPHLPKISISPEYIFLLFLPPLLYSAAWQMPWREFRRNMRPILLLAVGFVIFTTCIVGVVMHYVLPGLPWAAAFALGAIVSPPDAVAATSITQRLGVPRRAIIILEGESLINDASGLTLLNLAVLAVVSGPLTVGHVSLQVLRIVGGGIAFGLVVGWIVAWIHRRVDDPMAETVVTLITPFAAFLPAEVLGLSPILSTVVAGLYVSRLAPHIFTPRLRQRSRAVWNTITFILNGLVFGVIGLEMNAVFRDVFEKSWLGPLGYAALLSVLVVAARLIWIFPTAYFPRKLFSSQKEGRPSWREVLLVGYTGMRGVISLVAALSLPLMAHGSEFPGRRIIIFLTFVVILVTLLVQSLTLPSLVRHLHLPHSSETDREEHAARLRCAKAALQRLEELSKEPQQAEDETMKVLQKYYQTRANELRDSDEQNGNPSKSIRRIRHELAKAQQQALLQMYDQDEIDEEVLNRITNGLDLEMLRLGEEEG